MKNAKNPTANAAPDGHKKFCERCHKQHGDRCPITKAKYKAESCRL